MNQLVCDNCHKPIFNGAVYYKTKRVSNGNQFFGDSEWDVCCDCAESLSVDMEHGDVIQKNANCQILQTIRNQITMMHPWEFYREDVVGLIDKAIKDLGGDA